MIISGRGRNRYSYMLFLVRSPRDSFDLGVGDFISIDLAKFFDRVNPQRLMGKLGEKIQDKRVLALIGRMLRARVVMPDGPSVAT